MEKRYVLDLSSLEKAITQLEQSLHYYHSEVVQRDPGLVLQLRAAAIQAFEFTYELSWKMIKRFLEVTEPNPNEIETMSFPDLIRRANERDLLLSDLRAWKIFRQERGATSHTYDEERSTAVFAQIPAFLTEAKYLLMQLQSRNAK